MPRTLHVELPLLPVAQAKARVLLLQSSPDLSEVAAVIEGDPGLTMAVLRAANSPLSAPRTPVTTARRAVVRLGLGVTREIVVTALFQSEFSRVTGSGLDAGDFWRHLVGTAIVARSMAEDEGQGLVYFSAGLLHDVGRLALASQHPSTYRLIAERAQTERAMDLERGAFGIDHQLFGQDICEAWGLPEEIVQAVGNHHHRSPEHTARAVYLAREVMAALEFGDGVTTHPVPDPDAPADAVEHLSDLLDGPRGLADRIRWYREATSLG